MESATKCVTCTKACNGKCSWSDRLEPVNHWSAIETEHGYFVFDCPEYEKETKENRLKAEDIDTDAMILLFERFMKELRYDYIHGLGRYARRAENRMDIEKFLRSKKAHQMFCFSDVEEVIQGLRKLARTFECSRRY